MPYSFFSEERALFLVLFDVERFESHKHYKILISRMSDIAECVECGNVLAQLLSKSRIINCN